MENVGCSVISGWAWNSVQPQTSVNVQIWDGSTLVATIPASTYRADVKQALGGAATGYYGFALSTPAQLTNGSSHSISVKIVETGFSLPYVLTGSTVQALSCPPSTAPTGWVENVSCQGISGWAYSPYEPLHSITVQLVIPGASGPSAVVTANVNRPDVAAR